MSCVRRGPPDPADGATEGLQNARETCGHIMRLGPLLFAAVPETGHNEEILNRAAVLQKDVLLVTC